MSLLGKMIVNAAWSWPVIWLLLVVAMIPVWGPLMPTLDGSVWPVTGKVQFVDVRTVDGGLSTRLKFTKLRDCEYLGVAADRDGISVDFDPIAGGLPITLPTGDRLSRPWVIATTNLEGIRLRWTHRCNPFWVTVTTAYP